MMPYRAVVLYILTLDLTLVLSLDLGPALDKILNDHIESVLENGKLGQEESSASEILDRIKRDKPGIYMKETKQSDLPICQNMKGILGKFQSYPRTSGSLWEIGFF